MTASTELETLVSNLNNGTIDADAFASQAKDIFANLGNVSDAEKIAAFDYMVAFIQDNYSDPLDEMVDGQTYRYDDLPHYAFEAMMRYVFGGPGIFKFLNQIQP